MTTISEYTIRSAGSRKIAPRTVYTTREKLEEVARREGRTEEAELSKNAQRKIASQLIDYLA